MGLSIKNQDVERMSRAIAARKGVTITEAIRQALAAEVARHEAETAERLKAVRRIQDEIAKLPDRYPGVSNEDLVGYDDDGLPT